MHSIQSDKDLELQVSIEQSLQDLALALGRSIDQQSAKQLYQKASNLLHDIDYAPSTLVSVVGTLLVCELQKTGVEEVADQGVPQ